MMKVNAPLFHCLKIYVHDVTCQYLLVGSKGDREHENILRLFSHLYSSKTDFSLNKSNSTRLA